MQVVESTKEVSQYGETEWEFPGRWGDGCCGLLTLDDAAPGLDSPWPGRSQRVRGPTVLPAGGCTGCERLPEKLALRVDPDSISQLAPPLPQRRHLVVGLRLTLGRAGDSD